MRRRTNVGEEGATIVEAAIVLPVLFLVLFGLIQYAFLFSAYITVKSAAAAGIRASVVLNQDPVPVVQAAIQSSLPIVTTPGSENPVIHNLVNDPSAGYKRVEVIYSYRLMFPRLVPGSSNGRFTINTSAVMK